MKSSAKAARRELPPIPSLLAPPDSPPLARTGTPAWADDLGLDELIRAFGVNNRYTATLRGLLGALTTDPAVIRWRQAVLGDFLNNPALVEHIRALLPKLADLQMGHNLLGKRQRSALLETADRLAELDLYMTAVQQLQAALAAAMLTSDALRGVASALDAIIADEDFQTLRDELPKLQQPLQNIASLTLGVNLDSQLQPVAVTLLSINNRPFGEAKTLLGRLLSGHLPQVDESAIAPLHFTPSNPDQRALSAIFQDLEKLITQAAQPIARALYRFIRISSAPLIGIEPELAFYAAAADLIMRLRRGGVTFCQPEIAPSDERLTVIDGLQNIQLLVRSGSAIPNSVAFDSDARIAVLTGPNSGGKTTWLRAVGLAHVMAQAGLPLPATRARLSPIDALYTHFPAVETQHGRLAEEAARLREICIAVTPHSLVLLNESLSSTTPGEAISLAEAIIAALRAVGVRAVFATHLIDLAERLAEIEARTEGDSRLISLVAGVQQTGDDRTLPTFQIAPGRPLQSGYAQEIARKYGITLAQLLAARRTS